MFTWGYWGWGNATRQFVEAADSVEKRRGFAPPLFVDIRYSRSVRAKGFIGNAFAAAAGDDRYVWMKGLGNRTIHDSDGPRIRILDPAAAVDLLRLAQERAERCQRVLFFCACEFPVTEAGPCHRTTVGDLLLKEAQREGLSLEIVEWPGGDPCSVELSVSAAAARKLQRGAKSVPIGGGLPLEDAGGLPWGSTALVHAGDLELQLMVGPARFGAGKWYLPVLGLESDGSSPRLGAAQQAQHWRRDRGMGVLVSGR
jgi:hypothetical protein